MHLRTDIVVVAYCDELRLLRLQARSINKYVSKDSIGTIHIILHDMRVQEFTRYFDKYIMPEYGIFQNKIKLSSYKDIIGYHVPDLNWWTQQSIKLLASHVVETDNYLILDCKNHFIRPIDSTRFYNGDNLMRMWLSYYHIGFDDHLRKSYAYFGGTGTYSVEQALPTITPFLMKTSIVRELISEVEAKENIDFHSFFIEQKFTEFFFYFGYLLAKHGSINKLYTDVGFIGLTYFVNCLTNPDMVDHMDICIKDDNIYTLGVHKTIIQQADDGFKQRIIYHWKAYGLVTSDEEATYFMSEHKAPKNLSIKGVWQNIKQIFSIS